MRKYIFVIILLGIFLFLVISSTATKSPICDEAGHHIASGYSYVKTADFRMNPAQPPLLRLLIGTLLTFLDPKLPLDHPSWNTIQSTDFSYQFLYIYNHNAGRIVFLSRLPMVLVSVLLGLLIFIWSKSLYGYRAGLFSFFLYVFSPTILANAGLAMLDVGCAFFMFLATYQYWKFLHKTKPNKTALIASGVCFGLAQSTKVTAILLYPIFFVFALFYRSDTGRLKNLKRLIIIFVIGVVTLWATYGFEFKPLLVNAPDVGEKIDYIKKFSVFIPFVNKGKAADALVNFAKNTPTPLSAYIITLLGITNQVVAGQQSVFFLGKDYTEGVKAYYLIDFFIKEPLPFILFIFFSLAVFFQRKRTHPDKTTQLFLIMPMLAVFISASLSKLQGGIRYLLPMYPFLFVWLADTANAVFKQNLARAAKMVFVSISAWYAFVSLFTYPHYLAYANELVGGINGFGYKVIHDIDWGQDLSTLGRYIKEKNLDNIKLSYFGTALPAYYGINYKKFDEADYQRPGRYVYAISLRYLRNVSWTKSIRPTAKMGYSIFLYDLR